MADKSPLFHMVAGIVEAQAKAYRAADPDTRTPRVTEADYARAEAAARVVKMARAWRESEKEPRYGGRTLEHVRATGNKAAMLAESVDEYNALLGKGE